MKTIRIWIKTFILLAWEIILFLLNLPKYLYQFFKGLRIFSQSYSGIIQALEDQKIHGSELRNTKLSQNDFANIMHKWINETIRLHEEHEKMFGGLFGILIAVIALFISTIALLIK